MRRAVAAVGLVAAAWLAATPARAHEENGYVHAWIDPVEDRSQDGMPVAYLEREQAISGSVEHPNGIAQVYAVLVPSSDDQPSDECVAHLDPNVVQEPNGRMTVFRISGTFPCNRQYELRATAQANSSGGVGAGSQQAHPMPLMLAVAIPPAPVPAVDAVLEIDGEDREVTLTWPAGDEPDLLGYVVTRTADGDTETLGQVDVEEERTLVDDDPPVGESRYDVVAVRDGPDDRVEQVPSAPTSVVVDVPKPEAEDEAEADGSDGSGDVDPALAGDATENGGGSRPSPGSLSSVRSRGVQGRPSPPTTADTGFSETIDYGETGGQEAAVPPGDNSVVALYDEGTAGSPWSDRETMTFVAGGLAVLSGAGTILTVTRRAARAAY